MHVQSTLNASNKANNIPVAVFKYRGKRKFLPMASKYEETIINVKEAFKIEEDVILYTSALDVCRDQFVDIHPSVYVYLRPALDEILVAEAGNDPEEATINRKMKARVSTATVSASSSAFAVARQLQGRPSAGSSISARTIQSQRQSLVHTQPQRTSAVHETVTRKESTGSVDIKDYHSASEAEVEQEAQGYDKNQAEEAEDAEEVEHHMQELEDEHPEPDNGPFEGEGEVPEEDDDTEERRDSEGFQMVPERAESLQPAKGLPSPSPAKPPSDSQARLAEELFPETPSPPPRTKPRERSIIKPDIPVKQGRTIVKPENPSVRTPSKKAAASSRSVTTSGAAPGDGNARIAIVIQVLAEGDEEGQSATFKMRGRHLVHKILKTACANFDLDFENASLFLAKERYDDDGELVDTDYVHCPNEKTASQCNIVDGARLVIQVDED